MLCHQVLQQEVERLEARAAMVEEEAGRAGRLEEEAADLTGQLRASRDKASGVCMFCVDISVFEGEGRSSLASSSSAFHLAQHHLQTNRFVKPSHLLSPSSHMKSSYSASSSIPSYRRGKKRGLPLIGPISAAVPAHFHLPYVGGKWVICTDGALRCSLL